MAIDFTALLKTVTEIQGRANELFALVGETQSGAYHSAVLGNMPFTAAEKATLVTKYQALKQELVALLTALP